MLAAASATAGLSPNAVTAASAAMIVGAVALLTLTPPTATTAVAVAFLLALSFAADAADGQLARLQGSGSAAGEWLDHVVDAAKGVSVHAAVLIAAHRFLDVRAEWLLVPLAFQLVTVTAFAGGILRELLGRVQGLQREPRQEGSAWRSVILLPVDSGILALVFLTLAWPPLFQVTYTALLAANFIVGASLMVKWYRELRGQGGAANISPVRQEKGI